MDGPVEPKGMTRSQHVRLVAMALVLISFDLTPSRSIVEIHSRTTRFLVLVRSHQYV